MAQWIRETAVPSLAAQRSRLRERRTRRKARRAGAIVDPGDDLTDDELSEEFNGEATTARGELAEAQDEQRLDMSQAEAQARYLAALAARASSEEQMRLVADANIGDGVAGLERSLAELPADQLKALIKAMTTNPGLFQEHIWPSWPAFWADTPSAGQSPPSRLSTHSRHIIPPRLCR